MLLVAGEASGDHHAARLVAALKARLPGAEFLGVGGEALAGQGLRILFPAEKLATMGLVEAVGHLPRLWRALSLVNQALRKERPALAILVDFPDFNFWVARLARWHRVPVMYYISPQVWAWRTYRVRTIARLVDRMVVIGDMAMAEQVMAMGFYISVAGPVTFKKARGLHEVAQNVPDDYLLMETDAPYLAPEPFRGKRNEPAYLVHTAQRVAELRGISLQDVSRDNDPQRQAAFQHRSSA